MLFKISTVDLSHVVTKALHTLDTKRKAKIESWHNIWVVYIMLLHLQYPARASTGLQCNRTVNKTTASVHSVTSELQYITVICIVE